MRVTLDHGEMTMAQLLTFMRQYSCRSNRVTDKQRHESSTGADIELLGAVSELAWAKAMNTYPDLTLTVTGWKPDAWWAGKSIDIKATTHRHGKLMVMSKANHADIYVLAIIDGATVDFVGYAYADDIRRDDTIQDHGYGPTHMLTQDQLRLFKADQEVTV